MTDLAADRREARRLSLCNRARNPIKGQEQWLSGYSDASFHPPSGQGGWGAWVRDDKTRVLASGPTPEWVGCSNDAELVGVTEAIKTALEHLDASVANIMVIKTDSQTVARWFGWKNGEPPKPSDGNENRLRLILAAYEAVEGHCVKLVVTWVKGHDGNATTKGYLNGRVDKMAGRASKTQKGEFFKHDATTPKTETRDASDD